MTRSSKSMISAQSTDLYICVCVLCVCIHPLDIKEVVHHFFRLAYFFFAFNFSAPSVGGLFFIFTFLVLLEFCCLVLIFVFSNSLSLGRS
ncbi:hypothetical protein RHMOL_Rhmol08G0001400 [Rhododendron molle]|uniref:Uncharacterized protein n=1 Tax=Rhododendron molle TaxID=49168 RepID=A0ACC0MIE3_RHOML|nr:hypothetical protein RHMOL_Rhmol08G0001400 [Rhododendron molle]